VLSVEDESQVLSSGEQTSVELLKQCFAKIVDSRGEGRRTFIRLFENEALGAAVAVDKARQQGVPLPPHAGVPITVKDVFDLTGSVTTAGSQLLKSCAPADQDALAVQRLRQAGFIIVGTTNMTEFAYSGLGINPHYGTPLNPFERHVARIPGGSSSGAAVAVSDGFAAGSIGTDTGGSCRIPAALCGLVGFKPTAARIPRTGVYPLAPSLDAVGTLGASVTSCAMLDAVLAGQSYRELKSLPLSGMRLAVPQQLVLDGMDVQVSGAFYAVLERLSVLGAQVTDLQVPEFEQLAGINSKGGFAAFESYAQHRKALAEQPSQYDPRVSARMMQGQAQSETDYIELQRARAAMIASVESKMQGFDALLMPTVPIVAPSLAALNDEQVYHQTNQLMLRNPSIVNFLDGCAISLPCHGKGQAPVGLTLMGTRGDDAGLLSIARSVEVSLAAH